MESGSEIDGALWPIVIRVRLFSRHWKLLASGAQLVGNALKQVEQTHTGVLH